MSFRDADWRGSYYALAIELGAEPDDARLTAALESLSASFERCPAPSGDDDDSLHASECELLRSIYGVLAIAESRELGVRALVAREKSGSDWIDLCVPSAMMERAGYRFDDPLSQGFLAALDDSFLQIADRVCSAAPFDLALVGEEVSGLLHARDFAVRPEAAIWYLRRGGVLVRPRLLETLPTRVVADRRPSGLFWIPHVDRNHHDA